MWYVVNCIVATGMLENFMRELTAGSALLILYIVVITRARVSSAKVAG